MAPKPWICRGILSPGMAKRIFCPGTAVTRMAGSSKAPANLTLQRQNGDVDPFGRQRVTEQDHIALRATAFESAHHNREIRSAF